MCLSQVWEQRQLPHTLCLCVFAVVEFHHPNAEVAGYPEGNGAVICMQGPARNIDEAAKHRYQFWDTQPVPKLSKLSALSLCK